LFHYYDTVANQANVLIPNATVTIYVAGTLTLAPLFIDDGLTAGPNPVFTNNLGVFNFFIADGRYDIAVTGPNISSFTQQNVEISDVTQAGPGTGDLPWQTDNFEVAELALANVPGTPPSGFMSVYSKLSPKHLFVKDDTGLETDLFTAVGSGAQPPLNSLQYDSAGSLAGSQFIYNPTDNSDVTCAAPCVSLTVSGRNSGILLESPSGNNFVNIAAEDTEDGANLVVQSSVTSPAFITTGQASFSYIGGNTPGGSCFDTTGSLGSSNPCAQGYVSYPSDIGTETLNGQDLLGFLSSPLLSKGPGQTIGTLANFVVNKPVAQTALGAYVPAVENTTNSYGLLVQDQGGFSTVETAAVKILPQTLPSAGTLYGIEALPGSGINLLSDGIDLSNEPFPPLPPLGRIRVYSNSTTGNLSCVTSTGANCLPVPSGGTGTVTSVGLNMPPQFLVSNSPVTTAGVLTATLTNEVPNTVFAGPGLNTIGGIFDGVVAGVSSAVATSISLTNTPTTAHDWAFFLSMADNNIGESSATTVTGTGTWNPVFLNNNQGVLYNQILSSAAPLTATATLPTATNWAAQMFFLALPPAVTPTIVQQHAVTGAVTPGSSVTFLSPTTPGNSILVVLLGAPSNPANTISSLVTDSQGNAYTPIAVEQNTFGAGEVVQSWLSAGTHGGTSATITWGKGSGNGVSGSLLIMELNNLAIPTGQPSFRFLQKGDVSSAGLLPIQSFSNAVLPINVNVLANTLTTVATQNITMPPVGGPWRAFVSYSMSVSTGSSGVGYAFWVNDGGTSFAGVVTGQSNGSSGGLTSASYGGYSTVTYSNGANITFTLATQGDHGYVVQAVPFIGSGPNSSFQIVIVSSN
jgi:hypothetical protein